METIELGDLVEIVPTIHRSIYKKYSVYMGELLEVTEFKTIKNKKMVCLEQTNKPYNDITIPLELIILIDRPRK